MNSQPQRSFATTRWSTVMRVRSGAEPASGAALAELGQRYRYPVYAYLRNLGRTPRDAAGCADAFLDALAASALCGDAELREAQFRRFLLQRLKAWIAARVPLEPRPGPSADDDALESRYLRNGLATEEPARAFERAFALEVLARALSRLQAEASETGHADMYAELVPWLPADPPPDRIDAIARAIASRPLTVVVALKRLRQRLRELVGQELADTVVSARDFAAEQHTLFEVLQPPR
jgi:hypothetical protein